ncbi:MAG: PHP domain-containing protein, partial [Acidobacteriota bacterium]
MRQATSRREAGVGRGTAVGLGLLLCLLLAVAVWALHVSAYRPLPASATTSAGGAAPGKSGGGDMGYPWRGAIHVHSRLSDGAGSIDSIVQAASAAGVDFLILTDHNPLGAAARAGGGWRSGVFVIVGEEISTSEGHLLALQVPAHRFGFGPSARDALADIEELGGWALVAHPSHPQEPWRGGWAGLQGLEVVNLASSWARTGWGRRWASIAAYPFNPGYTALRLLSDNTAAVSLWDGMTRLSTGGEGRWPRRLSAVASADAHGPVLWPLPLPRYVDALAAVNTVVWIDEPASDRQQDAGAKLLAALRAGRAAAEIASVGEARGFHFLARAAAGPPVRLGEMASWEEGPWMLRAGFNAPGPYRVILYRDGQRVANADGAGLEYTADRPGTYRAEVYRIDGPRGAGHVGGVPWVISNPIYLWPAGARQAAVFHRAPPLPAPPVSESLATRPGWGAESSVDARSQLDGAAGRLSWELELPTQGQAESYAALAWRPAAPVDWSRRGGLVLRLSSRRTLRFIVQVRCRAADGRERSWYHSLKVGPAARSVAIPWSRWLLQGEDAAHQTRVADQTRPAATTAGPGSEDLGRVT